MNFTSKLYLWSGLMILISLTQGALFTDSAYGGEVVDRIVAVVNDDVISLYELNQVYKPYAEKISGLDYTLSQKRQMLFKVRHEKLDQLINEKLADQEIRRLNIKVSQEEVAAAIKRIKESNFYSEEDFRKALAQQGLTPDEIRQQVKEQILRARLVNLTVKSKIVITKADIEAYYKGHMDTYAGEKQVHLRNIFMEVPGIATDDQKLAIFRQMETVLGELKTGGSFAELARQYSESSMASEGGDLGLFSLDTLSPEIKEAVAELKPGEFTGVLDTEQGYQIFMVEDIVTASGNSLEDVSAEIEEKLYNEDINKKYENWLSGLRDRAHIRVIE